MGPMRRTGLLDPSERFGLSDHACCAYDADNQRPAAAAAWIADGLRLGQRAMYIADAPVERLRDELADLPDCDGAIGRGALVVAESRSIYNLDMPIDAPAQLAVYSAAVEDAISDGYAGIRVAADITPLVADPARRRAHLQWEQLADRYMTEQPLAPLCLFDRRQVDQWPAIAHIHPLTGPDTLPFSLYAIGARRSALVGEIDGFAAVPLAEALATLPDRDDAIDVSALQFLDAHGAWVLQQALERRRATGRPVALSNPPQLIRKVWRLCGFDQDLLVG